MNVRVMSLGLAVCFATPLSAQLYDPGTPGAHPVASSTLTPFTAASYVCDFGPPGGTPDVHTAPSNAVSGVVFFPATGSGSAATGPFPLVGIAHGALTTAGCYLELAEHIASWGFVVAALDAGTDCLPWTPSPSPNPEDEAVRLRALLQEVESTFNVDTTVDWAVVGQSMGGAAVIASTLCDSKIRTVVPIVPYRGSYPDEPPNEVWNTNAADNALTAFDGGLFLIDGYDDGLNDPQRSKDYFLAATETRRRLRFFVATLGHLGATDFYLQYPPDPQEDERTEVYRIVTAVLLSEQQGREDAFHWALGDGNPGDVVVRRWSYCRDPILWARALSTTSFTYGVAGLPGVSLYDGALYSLMSTSSTTEEIPSQPGDYALKYPITGAPLGNPYPGGTVFPALVTTTEDDAGWLIDGMTSSSLSGTYYLQGIVTSSENSGVLYVSRVDRLVF